MLTLSVKVRKIVKRQAKALRKGDVLPAVLYGPKIKNLNLELGLKDFQKIYEAEGESSLISLDVEGKKEKFMVLIHDIQLDSLTGKPTHVDFYQPALEEETEVNVPLIFEGESAAVKELGGTMVKNISEVTVKAKPQDLPREIKVNIEVLKNFGDKILIKDLKLSAGVKISKNPEEIVALVSLPEKVEEELEKPIEEKVETVEKVAKKKEDIVEEEGVQEKAQEKKEEVKPKSK